MKKILLAASALSLMAAAPASAQQVGEVLLTSTVAGACGVGNHKSGAAVNSSWNQDDIVVNLADSNGQFSGATFNNRSFGNVWCNGPANVTIEVGSLVNGTRGVAPSDSGSFSNEFDLIVTTGAGVYTNAGAYTGLTGGTPLVLNTTGASGIATSTGGVAHAFETGLAQYSGFNVQVVNPGNLRPIAGAYQGHVRFTASVAP